MRVYEYNSYRNFMRYKLSFSLMSLVFLWSLYEIFIARQEINWIYLCFTVCVPIILIREFITLDNPTKIVTTDDGIKFEFFRKHHYYRWKDIKKIIVKDYGKFSDLMIIIVNEPTFLRGKYRINKNGFVGIEQLIDELSMIKADKE